METSEAAHDCANANWERKEGDIFARIRGGKNVRVAPLADAVGITPGGLYRAIRGGEVEAIMIGRAVFVPAYVARRLLGMEAAA